MARVLLVGPDEEENLSLRYLSSALLAAGHHTTLAPFSGAGDVAGVLSLAAGHDIAGLSMCFQVLARDYLDLAAALREAHPELLIVAGGHFASCAAQPLLAEHAALDAVVIHEGEATLVELAEGAPPAEVRGVAHRRGDEVVCTEPRPIAADLDALEPPDRRGPIRQVASVSTAAILGSRGCYGRCAYCCIHTLHQLAPGKRFRQRSVPSVVEEMAALYEQRGVRQFVFHDDNFLVPARDRNLARLAAFEKELDDANLLDIALVIKCRPPEVQREVFERLVELGLLRVFLGIETASEEGLACLDRQQSLDDAERSLRLCSELEVSAQFTIMAFHPAATLETLWADHAFLSAHAHHPWNLCRTELYAGTPLEARMLAEGRCEGDYLSRSYRIEDPEAQRAWELALRLLWDRCFTPDALQNQSIRLDHAGAVVRRFRGDLALSREIDAWRRDANESTVRLLGAILHLAERDPAPEEIELLKRDEVQSREALLARARQLWSALEPPVPGPDIRNMPPMCEMAAPPMLPPGPPEPPAPTFGSPQLAPPSRLPALVAVAGCGGAVLLAVAGAVAAVLLVA